MKTTTILNQSDPHFFEQDRSNIIRNRAQVEFLRLCFCVISSHFGRFLSLGCSRHLKAVIQVSAWNLWQNRNGIQFNNISKTVVVICEEIMILSFTWPLIVIANVLLTGLIGFATQIVFSFYSLSILLFCLSFFAKGL